jgi:MobA/MobL family
LAIYSCAVSTVGRSTHAEGTAGAHLRYIGREAAASSIEAGHMPDDPQEARTWMDEHEREARKNARLCSKVRVALPRELTHAQNAALMRSFLYDLTGMRVPWFYAIHDQGKDAQNPHAHLVLIDRDIETGKRILLLSDSPKDREKAGLVGNGVEWIRERWERHVNQALEQAGQTARIDRRTLKAQGIDREPTIHIGPRANLIDQSVNRPQSKVVPSPTPRHPDRVIDYPMIDAGRTRRERNAEIIDLNLEKAARSPDFDTRVWGQFEREQRAKDRPIEAQRTVAARRRTLEERRLRDGFKKRLKETRAQRNAEAALSRAWTNQRLAPEIADLRARQQDEAAGLARRQGRLIARFVAAIDITGTTRRKRATEAREVERRHRQEQAALAGRLRETRAVQAEAVRARYQPQIDDIKSARRQQVGAVRDRHRDEIAREDIALQAREAEREHGRQRLQEQVENWKKAQRDMGRGESSDASRLGRDWSSKDDEPARAQSPQERAEQVRRRLEQDDGPSPGPDRPRRRRR